MARKDRAIIMRPRAKGIFHFRPYADASFATNYHKSSQLGYIVLLADKFENANILHYISHNSKRVASSVLGAETYAFADAFDLFTVPKRILKAYYRKM